MVAPRKKKKISFPPNVESQTVDVTREYEVFSRLKGNRPVDEAHVTSLMKAMEENDLFTPILVNQDFQVIDGQHRLEARKRLGLEVPFYWVDGLNLRDVQQLNTTQKAWRNEDYVDSFIEQGKRDYQVYKWFRDTYGFPHGTSCVLLTQRDIKNLRKLFISGQFKVKDIEWAKKVAEQLLEMEPHYSHWKDSSFLRAILFSMDRVGFSWKTWMHKVKSYPALLYPCASIDQSLSMIETLYNYKSKSKIPIKHGPARPDARYSSSE